MLLVKVPVPVPSDVFELAVVGFCVELQQTPRAVTVDPPAFVTLPPLVADQEVMDDSEVVETSGATAGVTTVT